MNNNQKGFIGFIIIIALAFIIGGSATYWYIQKQDISTMEKFEVGINTHTKTEISNAPSNTNTSHEYTNVPVQETKPQVQKNLIPTTVLAPAAQQSIVWSFDVITRPGEETETRKEISVTISGKKYKTSVADVGCGTEIPGSQLRSGQLSAIVCGPYAGSATEYSLQADGEGFKLVRTELIEDSNAVGGYKRAQSYVAASLKADGSVR